MTIKQLYQLYKEHPCITTDSRDCPEGSIFLALKGDTFDGNKFALAALEKGCSYAIVDSEELRENSEELSEQREPSCLHVWPSRDDNGLSLFAAAIPSVDGTPVGNYSLFTFHYYLTLFPYL